MALGTEELAQGIEKGSKIRVKGELTIYHSPKLGASFNLEGQEGTVIDVRTLSDASILPRPSMRYLRIEPMKILVAHLTMFCCCRLCSSTRAKSCQQTFPTRWSS